MSKHTYTLNQSTDGTYAWHAKGSAPAWPVVRLPDMQLLGYAPDEVMSGARKWLDAHGIDADVVIGRVVSK